MMMNSKVLVGYDLDEWNIAHEKEKVMADFSLGTNRHTIIAGESGGGKSYMAIELMARICSMNIPPERVILCDYKREDSFAPFRGTKNYFDYDKSIDGLEMFYDILMKRLNGQDTSRAPVYLFFDEYLACLLSLKMNDKKKYEKVMLMVTNILAIARSMNCNICIITQTALASIFPEGSRLNFANIIICGKASSLYEVLLPKECILSIGNRKFNTGEGVALIKNQLHFIKIPTIRDEKKMQDIIIKYLEK